MFRTKILVTTLFAAAMIARQGWVPPADHHQDEEAAHHGHFHGDEDDQHSDPESPCHHDDFHGCCPHSHAPVFAVIPGADTEPSRLSLRVTLTFRPHSSEAVSAAPFHVPIA